MDERAEIIKVRNPFGNVSHIPNRHEWVKAAEGSVPAQEGQASPKAAHFHCRHADMLFPGNSDVSLSAEKPPREIRTEREHY